MTREPAVNEVLILHLFHANSVVQRCGSSLLRDAFQKVWPDVDFGNIAVSLNNEKIIFDAAEVNDVITGWIKGMETLKDKEFVKFKEIDLPSIEDISQYRSIAFDIDDVIDAYHRLKNEVDLVEEKFGNKVRVYRSPLRQALNDIALLYNDMKDKTEGDFSDFENVSVYMHGIESDGEKFFDSALEAADEGDIIIRENRDGEKEHFIVEGDEPKKYTVKNLKEEDEFKNKDNRIHYVYDSEDENEHRQETSDDLTEKLMEMGLVNDATQIDLFGHSYGGRRSFQFAMDHPDHVQSVTSIGAPYDTNILGTVANAISEAIGIPFVSPEEYSGYQDFNTENRRTDDGIIHSNVYTDMSSEKMADDINYLKATSPEVYQKLQDIDIMAAAGHAGLELYDGLVSVGSQHGEKLGDLIDERLSYQVGGFIGHLSETRDEEFVELISEVNQT